MMMCFLPLQFFNVVDFLSVKPTLHSSDEPHLVLIYFHMLLDSSCFYLFRILAAMFIYRIDCDFPFFYCPCRVLLSWLHKLIGRCGGLLLLSSLNNLYTGIICSLNCCWILSQRGLEMEETLEVNLRIVLLRQKIKCWGPNPEGAFYNTMTQVLSSLEKP